MEEKCQECKNWEKNRHLSQFQCMQFCQILDGDFHTQLMIPKKFSENAREKLQETVTLRVPSGTATWQVKLTESDDALFLKDGWREFLTAFAVEKNDILVFKYTGNSCFHVLIFDQQSLCEKESSYFIKKCGHLEPAMTGFEKKVVKESPEEVTPVKSLDDIESNPLEKHEGETHREKTVASEEQVTLGASASTGAGDKECPKNSRARSWGWEPVKLPTGWPVAKKQKSAKKEACLNSVTYISKRRPVTAEEKKLALQMAKKELKEGSFLVVMRPSHVYKKFFLTIPAEWIAKNQIMYEKQAVRLQANEKIWTTRLVFSSKQRGGLSFGWKEFSLENSLEESDVLVFKLANQTHESVLLDVSIFRVVPEAVKSIRISPTSPKKLIL